MATLQLPTLLARLDPFPEASGAPGPGAQSAEGRKIDKDARDACRHWQQRAGAEQGPPDSWELKNRRRLFLINKKFHSPGGLSAAEEEELHRLQADFESYLDFFCPLPSQLLDELEALVEQLEAEDERS
jgi:hypothetical protein